MRTRKGHCEEGIENTIGASLNRFQIRWGGPEPGGTCSWATVTPAPLVTRHPRSTGAGSDARESVVAFGANGAEGALTRP